MKKTLSLIFSILFCVFASAADPEGEKLFYNCKWESTSTEFGNLYKLITSKPELVDWRFTPCKNKKEPEELIADSIMQRQVSGDTRVSAWDQERRTGFFSLCSEGGWLIGVYTGEPLLKSKGKDAPVGSFEVFFAPGAADDRKNECGYQLNVNLPDGEITEYPRMSEGKDFRSLKDSVKTKTSVMPEGAWLTTIFIPWEAFYDRLPLSLNKNTLWCFAIFRRASNEGVAWGAKSSEIGATGYIRWPRPSETQLSNIYKSIINSAWKKYQTEMAAIRANMSNIVRERSFEEGSSDAAVASKALANQQADKEFFESKIKPLFKENEALGEQIQKINTLKFPELETLYGQIETLSNCQYSISEARRDYLLEKMFKKQ